jgi:hypothetical protein
MTGAAPLVTLAAAARRSELDTIFDRIIFTDLGTGEGICR